MKGWGYHNEGVGGAGEWGGRLRGLVPQKVEAELNELNFLSEDWGRRNFPGPLIQPPVSPPEDVINGNLLGEPVLKRERNEKPQTIRGNRVGETNPTQDPPRFMKFPYIPGPQNDSVSPRGTV